LLVLKAGWFTSVGEVEMTVRSFSISLCALLALGFLATEGLAYDSWDNQSSAVDNGCIECHGGFRDGGYVSLSDGQAWNDDLHDGHRNAMLDRDCDACHVSSGRSPTFLNLSVGGVGLDPIGCVGCHGRAEDRGTNADCVDPGNPNPPCGDGAGLRQHHFNAGVTDCASCHLDSDPLDYTPVGENVPPPYYFTPDPDHVAKPTDPCNPSGEEDFFASVLGLDNDGDLAYDVLDIECAAPPEIDVAPLVLDFGAVAVGNSATLTTTIENLGGQDLTITALTLTGSADFALNSGMPLPPFLVAGGATVEVLVDYTPSETGVDSGALEIASDDSDEPIVSVSLAGSGIPPTSECQIDVVPLGLDFGSVEVGETATLSTAIGNNGTTDCVVSSLTLTGADFSLGAGAPDLPLTVSLGQQVDVPVDYTPTSVGSDSGTLDVISDDPNNATVTVALSGVGIAPRDVDVSPLALDFGSVDIPGTAAQTVTVQNLGGADLTVTGLALAGSVEFSFGLGAPSPPFVLAPGGSVDVSIDYTPTDEGSDSGTLQVASDDPDESLISVSLSGTGVVPASLCDIDVNPLSLDLGLVEVGAQVTDWVFLQNTGSEDCVVSGLTLTGDAEFSFNPATTPPPFTVRPGGFTRGIPIDYTPSGTGTHSTTLAVTSNDPDETTVSVPISGTGVPATPDLELSPLALDFGSVEIGTTAVRTLVIGNVGHADLTVTGLTLTDSADFALGAAAPAPPFSIAAGGSVSVPVEYTTPDTGSDSGLLEVASDDPDEPVVSASLSGTGIPPLADQDIDVSPLSLDFGSVEQGTSAALSTTIRNLGESDLTVTALTLAGSADFSLNASLPQLPFLVPAGGAVDVQVDYTPADIGADSGTLAIESDDPDEPSVSVSLAGSALAAPDIDVSPLALDFGSVVILSTATQTVTLQNLGGADLTVTGLALTGSAEFAFGTGAPSPPLVLTPGGSVDVSIDYTPADENSDSGTLQVTSDDPDESLISISLNGTGTLPTECDIDVNPLSRDLGGVDVGTQVTGWIFLENTCTEDCVVSALTLTGDAEFSFNPATVPPPFTVRPGGFTRGIPIDYSPSDASTHSTTLAVTSNDPDEATVSVPISGTGVGSTLNPDVELSPLALDFGSVEVDTTSTRTLVIGNVGNADLTVTGLTLTGSADFALGAAAPAPPFSIAAGGSMNVPVEYMTPDAGADSGSVEVTSDDPDEPVVSASLSGTGLPPVADQDIDVSPLSLDFGTVTVGDTSTLTTTIHNVGGSDLTLSALTLSGSADFALAPGAPALPFTLLPGGSVDVALDYTPSDVGADSGTLAVDSDDPDQPSVLVSLSGSGQETGPAEIEVSPLSLDFGTVPVGTTSTLTTTIRNLGGADLTVDRLRMRGSGDFELDASAPSVPFVVAPGASVELGIDFTPSKAKPRDDRLVIDSDDPDEDRVEVSLSGVGQ
jgi:hypothetical protein